MPSIVLDVMPSIVWGEITYPFLNSNGPTDDVLERIGNFIPHFVMGVTTYPSWH